MKSDTLIKTVAFLGLLAFGFFGMLGVEALGEEESEAKNIDTRPVVKAEHLEAADYTISIEAYGEVAPLEATNLAAQVSGEVVEWNPDFLPGGIVKRGELLFSIEKDAYEAALLVAEANVASAQSTLIQEQAQAEVAKREAKSLPDSRVTDLYLRKPQILSAEAALKSAQAQLKIAQRDLDNCEIRAPYDALIVSRDIGKGDYVTTGSVTAVLNNVETAEITFPVAGFDQAFLPLTIPGTPATVSLSGKNDNLLVRGAVLHRDTGIVDQATRMSHLVARIDDPYGLRSGQAPIKFGTYTKVKFNGRTLANVYRLPQELVNKSRIWVLDNDDKLVAKKVTVLREEGRDFLLTGDLSTEDRIVTTLPEYPQNGLEVKVSDTSSSASATSQASIN